MKGSLQVKAWAVLDAATAEAKANTAANKPPFQAIFMAQVDKYPEAQKPIDDLICRVCVPIGRGVKLFGECCDAKTFQK
jgi:hypothetical protein